MLRGEERIDLNFIRNMKQGEFVPEDDFLPLEGSAAGHAVLQPGDFLICFPDDGHMTGIQTGEPQTIKSNFQGENPVTVTERQTMRFVFCGSLYQERKGIRVEILCKHRHRGNGCQIRGSG